MANVYLINAFFKGMEKPVPLFFDTLESAIAAYEEAISKDVSVIQDDYGHRVLIEKEKCHTLILADAFKEHEAHEAMTLLNARAQMRLQKRVESDPSLKLVANLN